MIRTQIEAIVGQLTEPTAFLYGTADELNVLLETQTVFPVALLYSMPPIPLEYTLSNAISNSFPIIIKFLYQSTFDQNTDQNEGLVTQALLKTNEFMVKLANYRASNGGRYFKVHSKDRGTALPVYNDFDTNLTGIKLSMTVNTMYNDNVALPPFP